jgi:hypothetical protein
MTLREKVVARLNELGVKDVRSFIRENFGSLSTNVGKDSANEWLLTQEQAKKATEAKAERKQVENKIAHEAAVFEPETIQEFETAINNRIVLKMSYRGVLVNMVDLFVINRGVEFCIMDHLYTSESVNIRTAWRTAVRLIDDKLDSETLDVSRSDLRYYPDSLVAALYERHDNLGYLRDEMYRRNLMLTQEQAKAACRK